MGAGAPKPPNPSKQKPKSPPSAPPPSRTDGGLGLLPDSVVRGLRADARRRAAENGRRVRREAGARAAANEPPPMYDTVAVSLRHGLETLDILRRRGACGAVRQSGNGLRLLFLTPAGTAERWHLPGSACTPGPRAAIAPATDPCWLTAPTRPDGALRATDPWVLRSALCEAACTLTAGGAGPF
jgi:hypothetical protein